MKTRLFLALAALLGAAALIPSAQAGLLTPVILRDISSNSPVDLLLSTNGTPFAAANFGSMSNVVRNGVSFPAAGVAPNPLGTNWSAVASGVDTNLGGFIAIDRLFFSEIWGSNPTSVTVSNLNPARTYLVQILYGEPRSCCAGTFATNTFVTSNLTLNVPAFTLGNSVAGENPPNALDRAIVEVELAGVTNFTYRMFSGVGRGGSIAGFQVRDVGAPLVTTLAASTVTSNSAVLNATVNPNNAAARAYFQYGTTTNYGSFTANNNLVATNIALAVSNAISGLLPATTYQFRVVGISALGTNFGRNLAFTTRLTPPAVTTLAATAVTTNAATLNGTVNPGGDATACYFEYGPTASYGSVTATNLVPATNVPVAVDSPLTGLPSSAIFHFRLVAMNSLGAGAGEDATLHTPGATNFVSNTNNAGSGSLREAIVATLPGGFIFFDTNLSGQTIRLTTSELVLDKSITIDASALPNGLAISGNAARRIFSIQNSATVSLDSLTLNNGSAVGNGGAILNGTGCTLTLNRCTLSGNRASGVNPTFLESAGDGRGGAIHNAGTLMLSQSTFSNNLAIGGNASNNLSGGDGRGGAIYNAGTGTLTLSQSAVSENRANGGTGGGGGWGGGLYNAGTITLVQSALTGDSASGGAGNLAVDGGVGAGGGLYNAGTLMLSQSTLFDNHAKGGNNTTFQGDGGNGRGGGIENAGTLTLLQCTLAGNSASGGSGSGGLVPGSPGTGAGGAMYVRTNASVQNCLIALNTGGTSPDVFGPLASLGHNLLGKTNGCIGLTDGINGDLAGSEAAPLDPLIGPLTDNGGPTLTKALLLGSPAINAGDDSAANSHPFDQRGQGYPRLRGLHVDIGAYEFDTTVYAPLLAILSTGSVVLDPVTRLGSLTIEASVNPNGILTEAWIEFGPSPAYGSATARVSVGDGTNSVPVSLPLTGLFSGVTVHYRVVASNLEMTSGPDSVVHISLPGDFNADGVVSQTEFAAVRGALTNELATLNAAGYYTPAQVQTLNIGTPLLSQIAPGQFKLTLGVQKATQLTNFVAFPFLAPQTTINGQGQLEFLFSSPDVAAFYRLEAR